MDEIGLRKDIKTVPNQQTTFYLEQQKQMVKVLAYKLDLKYYVLNLVKASVLWIKLKIINCNFGQF